MITVNNFEYDLILWWWANDFSLFSISWMKFQSCSFVYLIRTTICELNLTELSTDQIEQQINKYFTMMSFGYHSNNTANHHTNSKHTTHIIFPHKRHPCSRCGRGKANRENSFNANFYMCTTTNCEYECVWICTRIIHFFSILFSTLSPEYYVCNSYLRAEKLILQNLISSNINKTEWK